MGGQLTLGETKWPSSDHPGSLEQGKTLNILLLGPIIFPSFLKDREHIFRRSEIKPLQEQIAQSWPSQIGIFAWILLYNVFLFWQDIAPLRFLCDSGSKYFAVLKIWAISASKLDFICAHHRALPTVWEPPSSLLRTDEAVHPLALHT